VEERIESRVMTTRYGYDLSVNDRDRRRSRKHDTLDYDLAGRTKRIATPDSG